MNLSDKILKLRKQNGLSQEELAEKLNVSRQAISRWKLGSAQPDVSNILQLSKLFKVTTDYLLQDDYEGDSNIPAAKTTQNIAAAKMKKIISVSACALGLLGIFILYLLSRFVEVMVPHITYKNGEKIYTWRSDLTGHSYKYFIQEYDLELLVILLFGLVVFGFVSLLASQNKLKTLITKYKKKAKAHRLRKG